MKLKIKKFMPIKEECEIDLNKKFLVFVGKNNSGKTYVSQLIWGIFSRSLSIYVFNNNGNKFLDERKEGKFIFELNEKFITNLNNSLIKILKKI